MSHRSPARTEPAPGLEADLALVGLSGRALTLLGSVDQQRLLAELDRFYAYGFGLATQRRFLAAPHPRLRCRTPLRALDDGELDAVIAALHATLRELSS